MDPLSRFTEGTAPQRCRPRGDYLAQATSDPRARGGLGDLVAVLQNQANQGSRLISG